MRHVSYAVTAQGCLAVYIVALSLVCMGLADVGELGGPGVSALCNGLFVAACVWSIPRLSRTRYSRTPLFTNDDTEAPAKAEEAASDLAYRMAGGPVLASVIGIVFVVTFSQVCRNLFIEYAGFKAPSSDFWVWTRFGVASFLDGVLLDLPSSYGYKISSVQPDAFWSRTLLAAFRLFLHGVVIATVRSWLLAPSEKSTETGDDAIRAIFEFAIALAMSTVAMAPVAFLVGLMMSGVIHERFEADLATDEALRLLPGLLGLWIFRCGFAGSRTAIRARSLGCVVPVAATIVGGALMWHGLAWLIAFPAA